MLSEFKLGCNAVEATKNIYCVKGEGTINHSTIIKQFKKILPELQGQVALKPWIPWLYSKPQRQIQQVALGEY